MNGTETSGPFRDVIVGVDGRQGGRDAIALARLLLAPTGRLTLAHVRAGGLFPPTVQDAPLEAELDAPEYADSHRLLERERDAAHVEARLTDAVASSVGRGMHELAERDGADLLVVGSRNRGFFGRVLVGDDTGASLNGAPCAVAVAPLAHDHAPARLATIGVGYEGSPESKDALGLARELAAMRGATVRALHVVLLPTWRFGGVVGGAWPTPSKQKWRPVGRRCPNLRACRATPCLGCRGRSSPHSVVTWTC